MSSQPAPAAGERTATSFIEARESSLDLRLSLKPVRGLPSGSVVAAALVMDPA